MTNIAWMLESAAREHPEKTAVVGPTKDEYTYEEFNALSSRIGNYLVDEHGAGTDDVIAGFVPDSAWTEAVLFGVMKTGAICTFENHTLPYDVLQANIENTGADLVIADERVFTEADRLADDVDTIEAVVGVGEGEGPLLQDVAPNYSGDLHPEPRIRDDVAIINYTAGTTGRPKGVQLTHGTLESSVRAITEAYHGLTSEDTMLLFMPMYHTGGISSSLFSVSAGATHVIVGGWDPQRVMELTRTYDPTWYTYIVPTMARDLMSQDGWEKFDVSGIRSYVAGEPVPADL
jgi:long-chain acyl-CoA synthetase